MNSVPILEKWQCALFAPRARTHEARNRRRLAQVLNLNTRNLATSSYEGFVKVPRASMEGAGADAGGVGAAELSALLFALEDFSKSR